MTTHVPVNTDVPQLELCTPTQQELRTGTAGSARDSRTNWIANVRALLRHKIPVVAMAALGLAAALIGSAVAPRVYRSQASIQIQGINENFLNLREIFPTAAPGADNAVYLQTQAEMLRQDSLIEQVVRKLRLENRPGVFRSSFPENSGATPDMRVAVERVKKTLQIIPSRGSSIIQIVCDARDPQVAADVANTLALTFIEQAVQARQRAALETHAALSQELDALRARLAASRARLDAFGFAGRPTALGLALNEPLRRQSGVDRQFYDMLSRRMEEARLAASVNQSHVRLVGAAQPASRPRRPDVPLNLAIGLCGGLALGLCYAVIREQTDTTLRRPGEVSAYLNVRELGVIPKAARSGGETPGLALIEEGGSAMAEAFRATAASVLSFSKDARLVAVTSPCAMEGKSTVASNLGAALAEIGHKVLLIDADLRRPKLHKILDRANSWGLSDLLREKNAVEEVPVEALVSKTSAPQLYLLPGGTSADNIFALLWSDRMKRLLARFRQEFDYVIVDAPPCLEFPDARVISRDADGLLLVVRAGHTQIESAQEAVERLVLDRIPVMGAVLNDWDASAGRIYGYLHLRREIA